MRQNRTEVASKKRYQLPAHVCRSAAKTHVNKPSKCMSSLNRTPCSLLLLLAGRFGKISSHLLWVTSFTRQEVREIFQWTSCLIKAWLPDRKWGKICNRGLGSNNWLESSPPPHFTDKKYSYVAVSDFPPLSIGLSLWHTARDAMQEEAKRCGAARHRAQRSQMKGSIVSQSNEWTLLSDAWVSMHTQLAEDDIFHLCTLSYASSHKLTRQTRNYRTPCTWRSMLRTVSCVVCHRLNGAGTRQWLTGVLVLPWLAN